MGERKVVNKYIPADFDPSLVPRGKKLSSKDGTVPVRMMLPFSMQCETCHEFLYRGRKFNSRKEPMGGPDGRYLGIQRFRFYIKCGYCSRPISFLTDPKNADYEMESGATRNFELHASKKRQEDEKEQEDAKTEKEDPMKALENRVLDSQREMADLDNLEEIRAMNAKHSRMDPLAALQLEEITEEEANKDSLLTEEDEALIKSIQFGKKNTAGIKRLTEEDEAALERERKKKLEQLHAEKEKNEAKAKTSAWALPAVKVKKKRKVEQSPAPTPAQTSEGLSNLLGGYGSSSSSDSN